tara:strand:+ start:242 stop:577 length:336 start_codon:yes stop_codon:yes gene_type:complete
MPHKDPEERKAYQKEYNEKNKEQRKEYYKTDAGIKSNRISRWKQSGLKCDDIDSLYEHYLNCKNCENCNIELVWGNILPNRRCLDHSHTTGLFRNVLCNSCNVKRRENNIL